MFTKEMFIGFPIDPLFKKELEKTSPNILGAFIQNEGEYLQYCSHKDMTYLGKRVGKNLSIAELELIEKNIYSLLKKIVPEYAYHETPLYLFAVKPNLG